MLRRRVGVTVSAPKHKSPVRLLLAAGLIIFGALLFVSGIRGVLSEADVLKAPGGKVQIEKVISPDDRQKGLSGRDKLDKQAGMLFVFDTVSNKHCLWMKDMKISIDMVWMDDQKKVINVAENVSPETFPQTFCPEGDARYALETAAGQAGVLGIKAGVLLDF